MFIISGVFQEEDAVEKIRKINSFRVTKVRFIESNFNPEPLKKVVLVLAQLNSLESIQIKAVPERFIRLVTDHIANHQIVRHLALQEIPISTLGCLAAFMKKLTRLDTLELLQFNKKKICNKFKYFMKAISEIESLKFFRFTTQNAAMAEFAKSCFINNENVRLDIVLLVNSQQTIEVNLSNSAKSLKRKYNFIDKRAEVFITEYKLRDTVAGFNNKENFSPADEVMPSAPKKLCTYEPRQSQSGLILRQKNFFTPIVLATRFVSQPLNQRNNNQNAAHRPLLPTIDEMLNGDLTNNSLNYLIKTKPSF